MNLRSWLALAGVRDKCGKRVSRRKSPSRRTRLAERFEILEDRSLLASVVWDGGGDGLNWSDAENWVGDLAPDTGDDVTIASSAPVTLDVNGVILDSFTLNSPGGSFLAANKTFTVNGASNIVAGGVDWFSSIWSGAGTVDNAGQFLVRGISSLNSNFSNQGELTLQAGGGVAGILTINADLANSGVFRLEQLNGTSSVVLHVNGTLLNETGGQFISDNGLPDIFADVIQNDGTMVVNDRTRLLRSGGLIINNGDLQVSAGGQFAIGINQTFTQGAGTIDVVGEFTMNGGAFNFDGGIVVGVDPVLTSTSLSIGPASIGAAGFQVRGFATLSGDVAVGQTINVLASGGLVADLTADGDVTNHGLIVLDGLGSSGASLNVTSGVLYNEGQLIVSDTSAGQRKISADVINNGVVQFNRSTQLSKSGGEFTNNSAVTIAAGADLTFGPGSVFTQAAGSLVIDGGLTMNGDEFNFDGGAVSGDAPLLIASALNLGASSTGAGEFDLRGSSTLSGDIAAAQTVNVSAGGGSFATVTAAGGFVNHGLLMLDSTSASAAALTLLTGSVQNEGTIAINAGAGGSRTVMADIDNHGLLQVHANTTFNKSGAVYVNQGAVDVESGRTLTVSNGEFTNMAPGQVTGGGTLRLLNSDLFGTGDVTADVTATNANSSVNPGMSAGALFVEGDYANATLNIELGGRQPGVDFDQLHVAGGAALSGPLNVSLIGGFTPRPGDVFQVMTFASRTGSFSSINGLDLGGGLFLRPVFSPTDLKLVVYSTASPVNIEPAGVAVSEDGGSATYSVVLSGSTAPSGDVVVTVSPDSQLDVSVSMLTFTAGNWSLPQTVVVSAVDDASVEGLHVGMVTHLSASSDATFDGAAVADVAAVVEDNDVPDSPTTPDLVSASDSGVSDGDDLTFENTPTFAGAAAPGGLVEVFDGVVSLGTTTADVSGLWSLTSSVLGDGVHSITATVTLFGQTSPASSALDIVVDTTIATPSTPDLDSASDTGESDSDDVTSDVTPTFHGAAEPGSLVTLWEGTTALGATVANASGDWTITSGELSEGVHSITASAEDAAGNISPLSGVLYITIATLPSVNHPPEIVSLSTNSPPEAAVFPGQTVTITAIFTDADGDDVHTAVIHWGDGATSAGVVNEHDGSISGGHSYQQGGVFEITVSVLDDDDSDSATTDAAVIGAGINNGVLQIVGTEGGDQIVVTRWGRNHLRVVANFLPWPWRSQIFEADQITSIYVTAGGGDDLVALTGGVHIPSILNGGAGDDFLIGGRGDDLVRGGAGRDRLFGMAGNDVLVGGDGDDYLAGGGGRDVLIGGLGRDWLLGGRGRDLLIGGATADDDNDQALLELLDEWAN
ncbi:MAG: Ig-like domain-containing protein [Pirellulaceae bacterium]